MYVNVYLIDKVYGGPEEGGWYYQAGYPLESIEIGNNQKLADRLAERLRRKKYSNEGRRPISSVLSEGEYSVQIEDDFAQPFPKRRPHYE